MAKVYYNFKNKRKKCKKATEDNQITLSFLGILISNFSYNVL